MPVTRSVTFWVTVIGLVVTAVQAVAGTLPLTPLQTQIVGLFVMGLNLLAQWLRATYPETAIARWV